MVVASLRRPSELALKDHPMSDNKLADKLYLKNAKSLALLNEQVHPSLAAQLPADMLRPEPEQVDVVFMFAMNQRELEHWFPPALARVGDKGSLWIAHLKQSASKATDISRDSISAYARDNGATVVASVSLDLDWSALRLKRL